MPSGGDKSRCKCPAVASCPGGGGGVMVQLELTDA